MPSTSAHGRPTVGTWSHRCYVTPSQRQRGHPDAILAVGRHLHQRHDGWLTARGPVSQSGPMPDTGRPRGVDVVPFPPTRRAVTAAVRAGRRIRPMHGLVDVDVTEARRLLEGHEPRHSMTAFVIAATARAVAAHPEVHAYRDWRGRLVQHRHVDVQTLVEVRT